MPVSPQSGEGGVGSTSSPTPSRSFLCGVVEGFYGRPWTLAQRRDLFEKMETWGMTSYLYAPKVDTMIHHS